MPTLIARSDAFLILRKWFDERSLLTCRLKTPFLWVSLEGRITFLDEEKFRVTPDSSSPGSGFAVSLVPAVTFRYGDSRSTPEEADWLESGLLIDFGPEGAEGFSFVALCDFKV